LISFANFAPDRSHFDLKASDRIVNVIPQAASYGPFPSHSPLTPPLPEPPYGAFLAKDSLGNFHTFAASTGHIYRLDPMQAIDLIGGTTFDDLAPDAPRVMHLGVIGDFLFTGQTQDNVREVRWPGLNDETFWKVRQRSADVQPFPDGGKVQAICGFERGGLVFQEACIREMTLALDTPLIFTARKSVQDHGTVAPKSVVNAGSGGVFYLAQDGFYRYGAPPTPIGSEVVDGFFFDNVDPAYLYEVQGAVDPARKIVYWRWKSTAHQSEDTTDRVLAYHYGLNRWFPIEVELSWLMTAVSPGYTLEGLDSLGYTLETLPYSLDSRAWAGSQPLIAAFDSQFRLGIFAGTPMDAVLQTAEAELSKGKRTVVTGFRVVGDAATSTGRVGGKDTHAAPLDWGQPQTAGVTGIVPARKSARLHRFEVAIPGGQDWAHVHGLEPEARTEGRR
jgi:hypothetical protein